jgi:methyl-accepting chemotaxis protein
MENQKNNRSIRTKILLLVVVCILMVSGVLLGILIYATAYVGSSESAIAEEKLLEQVKDGLKSNVITAAENSISQYEKAAGSGVSETDAIEAIFDNIRNTMYSDSGYFFVYSYDGVRLVTPDNIAAEGTSMWDMEDVNGVKVIQELIAAAENGGDWLVYQWANPSTGVVEDKVSYATSLKLGSTEVMIGTGTYLPMIQATKEEMDQSLAKITSSLMWIVIPSTVAMTFVALLVLFLFFSKKVINPIIAIDAAASQLANGNTDVTLSVKSTDEIGHLAGTIDRSVREAFKSIEKARAVASKQASYQSVEVDKLVVNLERLSSGELYCDMAAAAPDEDTQELYDLFCRISENLHLTVNTLKTYIEEISSALGAMSSGDLSVSIQSEYRGDFVALKDSINRIAGSLSEVMSEINTAAEQVAAGTSQVSSGSQAISQGATEQAGAIEELSATLSEIAEQTKQNAASANQANQLTLIAKNGAVQGDAQMKAMQTAMREINEASSSISKIIKVIDDIAFQTNILALNAAVEAARAGAHGKGFAVVAEEVRNLAARSASAASETTALIEGSIKKTEMGTNIANETAAALASIVEGVEKAAQLVGKIAQASGEQASAVTQVNNGIEQMSQVVQTNSATSEETAASAEELASQADMLKGMVERFRLKEAAEAVVSREPVKRVAENAQDYVKKPKILLNDGEFGKY